MWIPKNEAEIVTRVEDGDLEETAVFDAKEQVHSNTKTLAKHIAAMSTDGGTLLFGVGEDENGQLSRLTPVALDGASERISNVVETCIAEPPELDIRTYPTEENPAKGYILVAVPASERAPHMVIKNNDNRYYGRNAKGNRRLSEGDVARLYERRQRWERNRADWLSSVVADAPFEPTEKYGFLHLAARPLAGRRGLLDSVVGKRYRNYFGSVRDEANRVASSQILFARSTDITSDGWTLRMGAEVSDDDYGPGSVAYLHVSSNGAMSLFDSGIAVERNGAFYLRDDRLLAYVKAFVAFLSRLHHDSNYFGAVDLGVALTGIEDAKSAATNLSQSYFGTSHALRENTYRRTERYSSSTLADSSKEVARELAEPLLRALVQGSMDVYDFE